MFPGGGRVSVCPWATHLWNPDRCMWRLLSIIEVSMWRVVVECQGIRVSSLGWTLQESQTRPTKAAPDYRSVI